jgi:hypothetical protein
MKADEPESDTHVPTNLTEDMLTNERYPAWSLDMATDTAKIAFWTAVRTGLGPDGPTSEIYVMNATDGSAQTNLTNNNVGDVQPDWGPARQK